jgi:hypothetical protein
MIASPRKSHQKKSYRDKKEKERKREKEKEREKGEKEREKVRKNGTREKRRQHVRMACCKNGAARTSMAHAYNPIISLAVQM